MKKLLIPLIVAAFALFMGSCASSKKVAYFQNIDTLNLSASRGLYDAKIMPKDMLTITVITTNPDASAPFNLSFNNTSVQVDSSARVVECCKAIWSTMRDVSISR